MKDLFSCFYEDLDDKKLKDIWESKGTRFVFDTNVLLSLYSFNSETRKDFFDLLIHLKDRIWIPYHVALEFQRNRINTIKKQRDHIRDMKSKINKFNSSLNFDSKAFIAFNNDFSTKKNYPKIYDEIETIVSEITQKTVQLKNELENSSKNLIEIVDKLDNDKIQINSNDVIRNQLDTLFCKANVGDNIFSEQSELNKLYSEGLIRYENKIPPGYMDYDSKQDRKFFFNNLEFKEAFGDLIIFKQLIEYSKDEKIANIIFVSEDAKEDWRIRVDHEGKKILGARSELKEEIYSESNVNNFYIFDINSFLKYSKNYLNINIDEKSFDDIEQALDNIKHEYDYKNEIFENTMNRVVLTSTLNDYIFNFDKINQDLSPYFVKALLLGLNDKISFLNQEFNSYFNEITIPEIIVINQPKILLDELKRFNDALDEILLNKGESNILQRIVLSINHSNIVRQLKEND